VELLPVVADHVEMLFVVVESFIEFVTGESDLLTAWIGLIVAALVLRLNWRQACRIFRRGRLKYARPSPVIPISASRDAVNG
jgi:hypothetical protein